MKIMDLEKSIKAVKDWYGTESFHIEDVVDKPDEKSTIDDYEQSYYFESVAGLMTFGYEDVSQGYIWFKLKSDKWLQTFYYA